MFKKLLNLLFRRKPKHPAIFRKMPDGGFIVAHTEEEADRYEADYLPTRLELEAHRIQRITDALNALPEPASIDTRVARQEHMPHKRIASGNHPDLKDY